MYRIYEDIIYCKYFKILTFFVILTKFTVFRFFFAKFENSNKVVFLTISILKFIRLPLYCDGEVNKVSNACNLLYLRSILLYSLVFFGVNDSFLRSVILAQIFLWKIFWYTNPNGSHRDHHHNLLHLYHPHLNHLQLITIFIIISFIELSYYSKINCIVTTTVNR